MATLDVDAGGRLVEHQQISITDQRRGKAHPLGLPSRKLRRPALREIADPGACQHIIDRKWVRIVRGHERDQLANAEVVRQRPRLEHPTDQADLTAAAGERAKTVTAPASGRVRPSTMSIVVVLPAPFAPSSATVSPGAITRSTPHTARTEP